MSQVPNPASPVCCARARQWLLVLGLPLLLGALGLGAHFWFFAQPSPATAEEPRDKEAREGERDDTGRPIIKAPDLDGGLGWLNTAGPIRMKDLRGKVVVLDFWTYCCINCLHTLPDLARLEKKYANELVVIGVHSAKFDTEKGNDNIRKAILRYDIRHPVVNDARMEIWDRYAVRSWPTLWLIDPEGHLVARGSGEGLYEALDREIARVIEIHKKKKTLNDRPLKFQLARQLEPGDRPLFFPGKVLADAAGGRFFIADSTHHRIVITDLDGKKIAVAGTGEPGRDDGDFDSARFDDPQGMALDGDTLYVADRKNHLIRALDLKAKKVKTIAGTGEQSHNRFASGGPLKVGLNSPWALLLQGKQLFIAMAGHHQIWVLDMDRDYLEVYAGNGRETLIDGNLDNASFAQPTGLATDGKVLYVADSETSAIRTVPLDRKENVKTIVGEGLFDFGDVDGKGDKVRLQHALGVAYHDGKLYVADTYNSKIKVIDPETRICKTFLGGEPDGWLATPLFQEPAGMSIAAGKLYVADTNAHRIRVIDLKTKAVSTLQLQGVEAPDTAESKEE